MKKLLTVVSSRPSCWEMVICISLEGRLFSLKMAKSVLRWRSVKTRRDFFWELFRSLFGSCSLRLQAGEGVGRDREKASVRKRVAARRAWRPHRAQTPAVPSYHPWQDPRGQWGTAPHQNHAELRRCLHPQPKDLHFRTGFWTGTEFPRYQSTPHVHPQPANSLAVSGQCTALRFCTSYKAPVGENCLKYPRLQISFKAGKCLPSEKTRPLLPQSIFIASKPDSGLEGHQVQPSRSPAGSSPGSWGWLGVRAAAEPLGRASAFPLPRAPPRPRAKPARNARRSLGQAEHHLDHPRATRC